MRKITLFFGLLMFCCTAWAQSSNDHVVVDASTAKFGAAPGLPTCAKVAALKGDPSQPNFVILLKTSAGCKVPWHWHTAAEQLGIVSGSFKLTMKDEKPKTLRAGSYAEMPGKQAHEAQCVTACSLFISADGPFDIHYVDASGTEIPAEQALKSGSKKAAPKPDKSKKAAADKK
ncbi:MAG: DUF4437 domain-containing protein [Acidobacteria bacterium]|nr:DUF4437 domain-containing protein [Acidobacteriota bacterium]